LSPAAQAPEVSQVDVVPGTSDEARRARERDKKRVQRARQRDPAASTIDVRPGRQPGPPAGNPMGFGSQARLTDPISAAEAERNIKHFHLALARIVRSRVNISGGELDEEFKQAGTAYSDVANHMLPWLRLGPRLVAPIVLVGALIAIWGAIIVQTPWVQAWWERRRAEREQAELERRAAAEASAAAPPPPPVVVASPSSQAPAGPSVVPSEPGGEEPPPVPVLARGYRRF